MDLSSPDAGAGVFDLPTDPWMGDGAPKRYDKRVYATPTSCWLHSNVAVCGVFTEQNSDQLAGLRAEQKEFHNLVSRFLRQLEK